MNKGRIIKVLSTIVIVSTLTTLSPSYAYGQTTVLENKKGVFSIS